MDVDAQVAHLTYGAIDCITERELREKLARGRPLRVKLGIDPTASDIHLGFAVVLRRLRRFQDLGHRAVLIIGDFTARVGDPSGRNKTRPRLAADEVERYARTYLEQVVRILDDDPGRLEVRRNSEWLGTMGIEDVLTLTSSMTVARMLERDDFATRYAQGVPITLTEFLYPLLQGYDSVVVEADVELGGTDQLFNLLVGRTLQEQHGQEPQVVLTTPLLPGLRGGPKMSKSLGNYVGIAEAPAEQFGKLMSIPDELIEIYARYTTEWPPSEVEAFVAGLRGGPAARAAGKRAVARAVVDLYHGPGAGAAAEAEFDRVFRDHELPEAREAVVPLETVRGASGISLPKLLVRSGLAASAREAVRKVREGGVRIENVVVSDPDRPLQPEEIEGKRLSLGRKAGHTVRVHLEA